MSPKRRAILLFLFFAFFFALTNSFRQSVQMPDEEYVLRVTASLAQQKPLHLSDDVPHYPGASRVGRGGKVYSVYQIGQSLIYAPIYFVIRNVLAFSEPFTPEEFGNQENHEVWLERQTRRYLLFSPILFAALSCVLFFLLSLQLGLKEQTALMLTFCYGLGTMVWPYSKYLLTETTQNTLLLLAVFLLVLQKRQGRLEKKWMLLAGAAFGLLLAIRGIFVVLLPILAVYWFYKNKERRLLAPILAFALPIVFFVLPQLIYDQIRFQNPFSVGYGTAGFQTPFWVGLYGYLFSSGKSFFLYTPIAVLFFFGIRRFFARARQEAWLFCLILIVVPLKFSGWWVWSGDPGWGPRYLLVLTPFLLLPVGEVLERVLDEHQFWRRGMVATLFFLSVLVQLLAVSVHYLYYLNYVRKAATLVPPSRIALAPGTPDGVLPIRDRFLTTEFVPEYSPIAGQWWMIKALFSGNKTPAKNAPWAGLGYTKFHEDVELKARWDYWFISMFDDGFNVGVVKGILGVFALLIVLVIVGQELLFSVFAPPKPET